MGNEAEPAKPPDRSGRGWLKSKWLWGPAGCVGVLVVVVLIFAAVFSARARSRWKDFVASNGALRSRVMASPSARVPFAGPPVPGNAWESYDDATRGLPLLSATDRGAIHNDALAKAKPEEEKRVEALLEEQAPALEKLRAAARRDSYSVPFDWPRGAEMEMTWLAGFRAGGRLLTASARRRRLAGDRQGAIEDLGATFQLGSDQSRSGPLVCFLIGVEIRWFAFQEAAALATDPTLTTEEAASFEDLLRRAEAGAPSLEAALEAEQLILNQVLDDLATGKPGADPGGLSVELIGTSSKVARVLGFRHGFSWRIAAANLDDALTRERTLLREQEGRKWSEASSAFDAFRKKFDDDPLAQVTLPVPAPFETGRRLTLARYRLLRMLLQERKAGGTVPTPLEDPFSCAPLHRREEPGRVLYWTEWTDGDDGASGEWKAIPRDRGDVVLEWRRSR